MNQRLRGRLSDSFPAKLESEKHDRCRHDAVDMAAQAPEGHACSICSGTSGRT